jgi:hypothetical protein
MNVQQPGLMGSADVLSTNKLLSVQQDPGKLWMGRLYRSPYCRLFYGLLFLLNIACIVWTVVHFGEYPEELGFMALEAALAVLVSVEVGWRLCLQGLRAFVTALWNLCDVVVAAGCLAALGCATFRSVFIAGLAGEAVLVLRTVLQYLRLVIFIREQHKAPDLQMLNFCELAQPKAEVPVHVLAEEEEKSSSAAPNNTGTAQEGSEDRKPRTLMIPNRA